MAFNTNPDGGQNVPVESVPDICPQCHHAVEPRPLTSTYNADPGANDLRLDVAFKCPRGSCRSMFIARYRRGEADPARRGARPFLLVETVPKNPVEMSVFPEVAAVSPAFVEIVNQASAAEAAGLDQIAGVGFRKALEFLVKDFCISGCETDDQKERIKAKFLGRVIADDVEDANIKTCAARAAWLGNDETHYVRKWNDKDLSDLKILIELVCVWVRSSVLTEQYLRDMGDA